FAHVHRAGEAASVVGPTAAARAAGDERLEVLRRPGVVGILVDARLAVVDRLHAERVVVRAEAPVDGRRPVPGDLDAGLVDREAASPGDRADAPGEVDRHREPEAVEEDVPAEPEGETTGSPSG